MARYLRILGFCWLSVTALVALAAVGAVGPTRVAEMVYLTEGRILIAIAAAVAVAGFPGLLLLIAASIIGKLPVHLVGSHETTVDRI